MKGRMHQIGIRGHRLQQQSAMVLDNNNNIINKPLLRDMTPHKSRKG